MKYKTIDELDARIESTITKTVKHYYTDWKNYDRPKYMGFKGSLDPKDHKLVLIARTCGTYLLRAEDIKEAGSWSESVFNYYRQQENDGTKYYNIDLDNLTIAKIA